MPSEGAAVHSNHAAPVRLVGLDDAGEPFLSGDRLLRGIYPGQASTVRAVLATCEANDLFQHGIVRTRELPRSPHPDLSYEMVLEHQRVQFVSYPHEWPGSMYREAALFHVRLYERLQEHGLTLKDWHPYNVLFEGTTPVFVDFTSIIPIADLESQPYLNRGPRPRGVAALWDGMSRAMYEMYRLTFEPYFGLPLAMMHRGQHGAARRRVFETTLNAAASVITRGETFDGDLAGRLRCEIRDRLLRGLLLERGPRKRRFFGSVRRSIERTNAAARPSDYSSYYEDKNEAFATVPSRDWTNKQHGVHAALTQFRPKTVLDLGSNTGWFSMLAARLGSSVVAVDLDEASIDRLYLAALREKLPVLPLVADLTRPLPEVFAKTFDDEPSLSLLGDGLPLLRTATDRLRCEMVLALAVVHHLALGQGLDFREIAATLGRLANRYLCVEFVAIDDAMITGDPGFFKAWNAAGDSFGWYTRDNFITELRHHFSEIEIVPSSPESRSLLICSKQGR
ncbi:MAG: class I SAM-dependent methyltransferase [Gemmatimonadaceae bacterium]|nr:class I SAM-dependent methyltransferase [Gemmatimonadaceae bacterium]